MGSVFVAPLCVSVIVFFSSADAHAYHRIVRGGDRMVVPIGLDGWASVWCECECVVRVWV